MLLVGDMEKGVHRFVVGDALGVVALDERAEIVRQAYLFLLNNFVITDDGERYVGGNDGELVEFLVSKETVGNLNDALGAHLARLKVETDGDFGSHLVEVKQVDDFKEAVAWDVVDDGAVVERRDDEVAGGRGNIFVHYSIVVSF